MSYQVSDRGDAAHRSSTQTAPNSSSLIEIAAPKAPFLYRLQNNRVMA